MYTSFVMRSWKRNLFIIWLAQVLSLSGFGFMLPFLPYYIQVLGIEDPVQLRVWVGLLTSGPALTMGLTAPMWGLLADRFGKKMMMIRSFAAGTLVVFCMGLAPNAETVLVLRLLQGMLTGTITAAAALVASSVPKEKLSSSLGFLSSSTFIGVSLGPFFGGIISELLGFRSSFFIGAAILTIGLLLVIFFVQEDKEKTTSGKNPAAKGFHLRELLTQPFIILFIILFCMRIIRVLPNPFIALHVQDIIGTIKGAPTIMGTISAGRGLATAVAGVTLSRLGDRHDRLRLILIFCFLAFLSAFPIFFTVSLAGFSFFFILSTFFLGGIEPLIQSSLSYRTPPEKRGLLFGLQTSIGSAAWSLSPLAGSAVSVYLSVQHVFLFFSLFIGLTAGIVAILYVKRTVSHGLKI
jgi:DHA1 family multidrug resistance protein-like MFS transporter